MDVRLDPLAKPAIPAPRKSRMLWALFGALVLGIGVPVFITCFYVVLNQSVHPDMAPPSALDQLEDFAGAFLIIGMFAGFFCGPGCLLLAWALMALARRWTMKGGDMAYVLQSGAVVGAFLAMLNIPGWMALALLEHEDHKFLPFIQTIALFVVTGGTCGLWLAWQAWREHHPDAGLFPRFSLRTLIALAFAWGFLFMLFMPQSVLD